MVKVVDKESLGGITEIESPVKKVSFYVTGVSDRQKDGGWCSILNSEINGTDYTKRIAGYGKGTTDTRMTLIAFLASLKQLNFKKDVFYFVTLYTSSVQLSQALNVNLETWKKTDFTTKSGDMVKHADLYKEIADFLDTHMLSVQVFRQAKSYEEKFKEASNVAANYVMKAKMDLYEII